MILVEAWVHPWKIPVTRARRSSTVDQSDIRVLRRQVAAGTHDFDPSGAASI
jgi:hypothetical protein